LKECSKTIARRLASPSFMRHYLVGDGLDIGGKSDPLSLYSELFPLIRSIRTWDLEDGDAQHLNGIEDETYDFVHSSHCLEHLSDPRQGLQRWFEVLKPGGHLIVTVPDEDLYEQGKFPSTFNADHRWTFTIYKASSWSPKSLNALDLLIGLGDTAEIRKIELLNATYRYSLPRYDQTLTPIGESGIEMILRKRTRDEVASQGRLPASATPPREVRIHLNQYVDDMETLKAGNRERPPFRNDSDL